VATAYSNHEPSLESGYSNEVYFYIVEEIFPASNGQLSYELITIEDDKYIDTPVDKYIDTPVDKYE